MKFEITGQVEEAESGRGVPGVVVSAFDKDLLFDDLLGEAMTDAQGKFRLEYAEGEFRDLFEKRPDIYLTVKTVSGRTLSTTEKATRFNATPHEEFRLKISAEALRAAGLRTAEPVPTISEETLTTLTCLWHLDAEDELGEQIKADLKGKSSILEMMKDYMAELKGELDNDAPTFRKLHRLFELGSMPENVEGHYYGVALGLRTGDLRGIAAEHGNLLGYLWGESIGGVAPWVGKSFTPMSEGDRRQVIGSALPDDVAVSRGINHFNVLEHAPVNIALNTILNFLWHLKEVPEAERLRYGHERNGGHFVYHRAFSMCDKTPREVFRLNYRFRGLDNNPPLNYLIDELVEIADGLYLGQLLFATARLLERYDSEADSETYKYQHFGYFLLFREDWNGEARRLFPHLEMPRAAVTSRLPSSALSDDVLISKIPDKFTGLTLADPVDGDVDSALVDEIQKDLSDSGTVIRLLKSYSDQLMEHPDTRSPVFAKLHTLFNAGVGLTTMDGFYRGALVSWQSQGLLAAFDINTINIAWRAARAFSPWTGKRFDPVDEARLLELTDNCETMDVPTFFCANTVVFRTAREKFTREIMKAVGIWIEDATEEERRLHEYDAKTFFFISKYARSVHPENKGKSVFQFNYRWKALRNPIPDRYCIDELVQIAEGLYLGKVYYATNPLEAWDPSTDPSTYKYRLFEYFILMDDEWHGRRLRIGFDLENI
ncbi:MAG: hypothetical protein JSV84_05125 [Gemmatimonadota bacterium]|nr:MAG: hypothetical protein JSV84_05125 [Gemmatimonadota bacterium]